MPAKKYVLKLSEDERRALEELIQKGRCSGWKLVRAYALLKCDQGPSGPAWSDARISEAFGCTSRSLENWRKQAVEQGPLSLLERKTSAPPPAPKLDGAAEARLITLACSQAPPGYSRWSLRLLAEHLVILEIVDSISHETVRRTLKKTI
jgi:transposase-like protein